MKKPILFTIRPDRRGNWPRKGAFISVEIYPTLREVRRRWLDFGTKADGADVAAFVHRFSGPYRKQIAVMVFARTKLGNGILAHEATHAALDFVAWCCGGADRFMLEDDEPICHAVGNIVRELTQKFYKYGVWK